MAFAPILLNANNPGPMTGTGNNTYLLVAAGQATLVDAGVGEPRHLDALRDALAARAARLDRVLVTHGHADHASGATAIATAHPDASFAKRPWPGQDEESDVPWQAPDDGTQSAVGDEMLRVRLPAGHSADHLAFWHEPS